MSSERFSDLIRRRWKGLPYLWKYQIIFWSIFSIGTFPIHFVGIRHVLHWQAPLYAIVFLRIVQTAFAILMTMGFGKILETAWYKRQPRWSGVLWICLWGAVAVLVLHYIERPLLVKPIYSYFGMFPSSGERGLRTFTAFSNNFILYTVWAGIFVLSRGFLEAKQKELDLQASETKRREIEILMLRSQLNPHFLFNAMNTIASQSEGNEKVDDLVEGLSDYLRYSLANRSRSLVPLGEEIEATSRYLYVEKIRFGDSLTFEIDADPASLPIPVPGIFLQPIVENAIKYGGKDSEPPLRVRIVSRYHENELLVEISNTGTWVAPRIHPDSKPGGLGLENLQSRLQLIYPERHEFRIHSADGWTSIRLILKDPLA